jgi:GGDEF domain-containing protein
MILTAIKKVMKSCPYRKNLDGYYKTHRYLLPLRGKKFIILLPNTDLPLAETIAEQLRSSVEKARLMGQNSSLTISLGIPLTLNSVNGGMNLSARQIKLYIMLRRQAGTVTAYGTQKCVSSPKKWINSQVS